MGRIATGMGKPFEKQCRFFVHPVTTVLSDQKAPIRTAALLTLSAVASACDGLESMVPGIHSGLETTNPMQKGSLLHWIADWFKEHPPPSSLDLSTWASSIVVSLDDRNADVRKAAQALLPSLIACAGFDYVMQQTNSLKPASRGSAIPLIQGARSAASAAPPTTTASTQPPKGSKSLPKVAAPEMPSSSSPPDSPGMSAPPSRAGSKISGVRRKLPQGNRPESRSDTPAEPMASRALKAPSGALKRPGASSALARPPVAQTPTTSSPLFGTNPDNRKARCGKDSHKWVNEGGPTRKDLAELLQNQMESHATKELIGRLFSHDHNAVNDHVAGLTMMCELYNSPQLGDDSVESICLANFDLPLKYASIKAHEPQPNLISKCLEIVETVLAFLRMANQQLTDNEALCFIPTIIFKVSPIISLEVHKLIHLQLGDAREQVRVRVQQIIQDLPKVYAYSRVFQLLLDYGLKSKVAKTRQGTLDEMGSILRKSGMGACEPSKAFPVIAAMISDKDSQVRKSALGALR